MNRSLRQPSTSASSNGLSSAVIAATGLGAGIALALLARAVSRRDTAEVDHEVQEHARVPEDHPARKVAEAIAPVGKWWIYVPLAGAAAMWLMVDRDDGEGTEAGLRQRSAAGAAVVTASVIAATLNELFDDVLPQPPAPPGRPSRNHPVFPSGHTFGTASVGLTAAWVLTREGMLPGTLTFPLAVIIPLASASGRIMEEKHWISDIAGGFLAAIVVASLPLALYELATLEAESPLPLD